MSCVYHAERPVAGVCTICGQAICAECQVELNGQTYCKRCLEARMAHPNREINGFIRFVLSICPGLGHLYMGYFNRGLQFMAGTVLGVILLGMFFAPLVGLLIPAMIFYSIFDAREIHLRLAQGLEVEDKGFVDLKTVQLEWDSRYIGYALVVIGGLALYNTLLDDLVRLLVGSRYYYEVTSTIRGITVGILAILAGVWLLRKDRQK